MHSSASAKLVGFLFVLPALAFVLFFVIWPFVQLVGTSFTNQSLLGGGGFVGLANYQRAFGDAQFRKALWFTLKYTVIITPILIVLGFGLALLTAPNTPLRQFTRAVIFLPVVIGLGASSLLWYWLFDEQVGLVNKLLVDLHVIAHPLVWFTSADMALWAVIISVTWKVVGFGMILFVAGIQAVGKEINEAAMIDGASYLQRVWRITLPLNLPIILLVTLVSAIGSMLAFDQLYIMTGGGPRGQTFTSVYWIYQNSFIKFQLGYGAALSVILTVIIFLAAALQIYLTSRSAAR